MRHTKHLVGGLLVAAFTITGVVAVDALTGITRAADVRAPARRIDARPPSPVARDLLGVYVVVELANAARAGQGLAPLAWSAEVAAAALAHSTDMAAHGRMTHTGSDGSNAGARLRRAGFDWTAWGENIAAGFSSAQRVFEAWIASPSHRRQMLGEFAFVGVAAVAAPDGTPYWTLDFAS